MENTSSVEVTLRLDGDLLTAIDTLTKKSGFPSRGEAIQKILQRWHKAWLQHKLDRETEAYYKSLTPEEIEEDRIWVQFVSEQAMRRGDD
jgi:metal-responsive CopG/Arc/MetJ family transcriptional regulator